MNKEEYFEKVYASFWHNQVKKYGFTQHEDFALRKMLKNKPKTAFEVGIGTDGRWRLPYIKRITSR